MFQKHFEAARKFQASGEEDRAAEEYRTFLVEALRRVADLRVHLGDYQQAEMFFQAALAIAPDDPDLLLDFAVMRLEQRKNEEAKSIAAKVVEAKPGDARAQYLLGSALCQLGDYRSAKEHLEAAVVQAPNFETGYLLGITYLKLHDLTHADLLFKDMIKGLGDSAQIHIYLGRAYRDGGVVERAVEELKKAVALDTNAPQVHYFLGLSYLGRDGDSGFAEAAPEFRAELKRNPNDYRSRYLLGYILLKQHNLAEAEVELKHAATLDPKSPDPLIYLGQLYTETDRPSEAERTLRAAISLTKDISRNNYQISRAHYLLGRILLQSGNKEEGADEMRLSRDLSNKAIQLERKIVAGDSPNLSGDELPLQQTAPPASNPEEVKKAEEYINGLKPEIADSYNNLGVIAAGKQDFNTALQDFRNAAKWQPSLETLDRNLGMAAFHANQFDNAVEPLGRHLQNHPDDKRVRAALALSMFALQRYAQVRVILKPIESEADADPGLSYAYAVSLLKSGDYNRGIARLRRLEKSGSNSAELHVLLGQAFADQNDWAAALQEYKTALAIEPKQAQIHFLAGLAFIRQGSPADAAQQLRAALQLDPANVSSKYHLAYALIELDKKDEALPLLREVLQQDPKHADAYYQLGKLQLERGETKAAISNLEASTRFKPDGDYIHYQLAMAYRRDSRLDDARRELKTYQELKARHRGRNAPQ
ncbi:MAG: tetratricopeptide repeat protein [Terriglobales bacterium]